MALDIIVVNHERGRVRRVRLALRAVHVWMPVVLVAAIVVGGAYTSGRLSVPAGAVGIDPSVTLIMQDDINAQRDELVRTRDLIDQNMLALAKRLGRLQAHMTRINAVGMRVTEMASIAPGEFDFDNEPAIGGPSSEPGETQQSLDELVAALDDFSHQLNRREREMHVLQELMVAGKLREQVYPLDYPYAKAGCHPVLVRVQIHLPGVEHVIQAWTSLAALALT